MKEITDSQIFEKEEEPEISFDLTMTRERHHMHSSQRSQGPEVVTPTVEETKEEEPQHMSLRERMMKEQLDRRSSTSSVGSIEVAREIPNSYRKARQ